MNKSNLLLLILFILGSAKMEGQLTNRQAGLRMGYRSGIYYQVSQEAGSAEIGYNALMSFNNRGIQLTGLKVIYENSLSNISPNLFFSWGYGGHFGFMYSDHIKFIGEEYYFPYERFCPLFGIDGWLSAEYRINDIPLIVSLNVKPFIELTVPSFIRVAPWDFAFSVAYVF